LADLITAKSWRAGVKLVHEDLGVAIAGQRRPRDLAQLSANDGNDPMDDPMGDHDDANDAVEQPQPPQLNNANNCGVLLHDLVTITAGNLLRT